MLEDMMMMMYMIKHILSSFILLAYNDQNGVEFYGFVLPTFSFPLTFHFFVDKSNELWNTLLRLCIVSQLSRMVQFTGDEVQDCLLVDRVFGTPKHSSMKVFQRDILRRSSLNRQ